MPRQCGVATFTTDICEAVAAEYPHCECIVGAVNDHPERYDDSTRIRFEIDEKVTYWLCYAICHAGGDNAAHCAART